MMPAMAVDSVVVRQCVADLDLAVAEAGAEVVVPVQPTPNDRRAVLRHPHGGVFEYVGP